MDPIIVPLLNNLRVKYTRHYLLESYNEHPYSNTLFGLFSMLGRYNIDSQVFRIDSNKRDAINQLGGYTPFVVDFINDLILITKVTVDKIEYYSSVLGTLTIDTDSFFKYWKGVVLIPVKTENSQEPDFQLHKRQDRLGILERTFYYICILTIIGYFFTNTNLVDLIWEIPQILCCFLGVAVCLSLLLKELNMSSFFADKLCVVGHKFSCDSIIHSKNSKIFNRYDLAIVGFSYFLASGLMLVVFPNIALQVLPVFAIMSMGSPIWSIWVQLKSRKWCTLCLMVQAILMTQLLIYIIMMYSNGCNVAIQYSGYIVSVALYGIIGLSTHFVMQKFNKLKIERNTIMKYRKGIFNERVISELFSQSKPVDTKSSSIIFGKDNAKELITVFSNPFCGPCTKLHPYVEQLYDEGFRIQYYLTDFNTQTKETTLKLMSYYFTHDNQSSWELFCLWYREGLKKGASLLDQYEIAINATANEEYLKHKAWINEFHPEGTPSIYLNSRAIPNEYSIDDLILIREIPY